MLQVRFPLCFFSGIPLLPPKIYFPNYCCGIAFATAHATAAAQAPKNAD